MFSSDKSDWETPQKFYEELDREFHFTLDAAASDTNHKCDKYYTEQTDGLAQSWAGETVFVNPPYGNKATGDWTKKCWEEAQNPSTTVVLLIPARTDRSSFHDYIYEKPGVEIRFIRGRLRFEVNGEAGDAAPFPSMVVVFRRNVDE